MSKTYLPYDPDQQLLLPAALQEWLPPDHLAYFISDVVDQLDLSAITARYEEERRGSPPYHPRMMVKVLLYGYCTGVASSWRIAQRLHEDIAFRVLAANNTPDFRTISDFRKDHLEALGNLFLQVLELCQQAGLVKLGHVALDGTKVRANASRHKAMSYGRMREREGQLAAEVAELLRRAGEVDDDEDRRYGKDKRGDELPEELAFRESRLRKIREAKAALEAEALAEAGQAEACVASNLVDYFVSSTCNKHHAISPSLPHLVGETDEKTKLQQKGRVPVFLVIEESNQLTPVEMVKGECSMSDEIGVEDGEQVPMLVGGREGEEFIIASPTIDGAWPELPNNQ